MGSRAEIRSGTAIVALSNKKTARKNWIHDLELDDARIPPFEAAKGGGTVKIVTLDF